MESIAQFLWVAIIAASIALAIVLMVIRKRDREEQVRTDGQTLREFKDVIGSQQRKEYAALPNSLSRLDWLTRNYPEFIAAAERQYTQSSMEAGVFHSLDLDLLCGAAYYCDPETAFRRFRESAITKSMTEYQAILDAYNDEQARLVKEVREAEAKRREENRARLEREAADLSERKAEAKKHWDSLTDDQKVAFKKATGKSARQAILAATSKNGSIDSFYPLIMAMEFGKINPNSNHSIDYSHSSSPHSDSSSSNSSGEGQHSSHHGGHSDSGSTGSGHH